MTTPPAPRSHRLAAAAWKIVLAVLPLGAGLAIVGTLLGSAHDVSHPATLALRIAAGLAISALTLAVIALLIRSDSRQRMRDAGLTSPRSGWRLAAWGALLWTVPAVAAFVVIGLLGVPLTVTVPAADLAQTAVLLFLAVLIAEALQEEAVFRGYITHALGAVARGWWVIILQALLFTALAGFLRQSANPMDLSLFLTMGIGFGWLRMATGSVWMSIGFHTAFQTGSQLVLTHDALAFAGGTGTAMLALGVIPFTIAATITAAVGVPSRSGPR